MPRGRNIRINEHNRVIIAGSRSMSDYEYLKEIMDFIIGVEDEWNETILSGTARGADLLGERYAKERSLKIQRYPANWHKYGKSAGIIRNKKMVQSADILVAFWDGKSKGTKHVIDYANECGLLVYEVGIQHEQK